MPLTEPRRPYRREHLLRLYAPDSIAVVGASQRAGSFGARTLANLSDFDGRVYPVNEKYREVGGLTCYSSLAALPEVPDLVVVTTPAATVESVIEDCIRIGVPAALVYASGFAELGDEESIARQARLARRAAAGGVKLLGPNCVGLLNYTNDARVTFAGVPAGRVSGGPAIGLICQSGALGYALAQSKERGVEFSHVLSCGNSADVDVADWISVLADDPACAAIACAFEGMSEPRRFLDAANYAWERDKPLIVYKMATGDDGAAAALSHTGSLAGSQAVWNALFERAGAVVVEDFEALIETAYFFAKAPPPKARGAAVLSGSGGAAIMAADFAGSEGVALPQPSAATAEALRANLPPFVQPRNPCDATAQVINDMESLLNCADALLSDPVYGVLVFGYAYAYDIATQRQPHLSRLAAKHGKPICFVWLTQLLEGPGAREAEADPRIVVFRSMRRCFRTLRAWLERADRRARSATRAPISLPEQGERVAKLIRRSDGRVLSERSAKEILACYGIPVPREQLARTASEAAEAARAIGGILALKIDSPDILHKTEIGGVRLNVDGPDAVGRAFEEVVSQVRSARPDARINGVVVQEMIPPGLEIIVGFRRHEGFGPTVTVGLGGIMTELLRDTRTALAPVDETQAFELLRSLRGARLFDGFRGAPPIALPALAQALSAISRLAADFGDVIDEFDVNPLICLPERVVAVDALAVLCERPASC